MSIDLLRFQMIRGLFWRPKKLLPEKQTVVIIDPMHTPTERNLIVNPAYMLADYVTRLARVNIDLIHYPQANAVRVLKHDPACVLISGQTAPWTGYDPQKLEPVFGFLRKSPLPVLGVCGGHQIVAQAFGAPVAPMDYREIGYIKVELLKNDPILRGLGSPITAFSWHGEEIKAIPAGFALLGSSKLCRIQIIRHQKREIYGVQFHPELSGRKADGKTMLCRFLSRAGVILQPRAMTCPPPQ